MAEVILEVRENVAHLTLNRPEAANALNLEMAMALEAAALKCEEDPNIRAVLMTGAGKLFCGGGDLKSFAAQPAEELPGHLKKVTMYLHTAIQRFARMKAPLVIAVNGNAGGAGLSLALIGDITLAGESTRFTVAYTRIGLTPDGSSTYYLPRLVGAQTRDGADAHESHGHSARSRSDGHDHPGRTGRRSAQSGRRDRPRGRARADAGLRRSQTPALRYV